MTPTPTKLLSLPSTLLTTLSSPIRELLSQAPYTQPSSDPVSYKTLAQSLLPQSFSSSSQILDFLLLLSFLSAASTSDSPSLYWIPGPLSSAARSALNDISNSAYGGRDHELFADLIGEVVRDLKVVIKESCVDVKDEEEEGFLAGSPKAPVAKAVVAAHQFRWLVTQIGWPHLGKLCWLVVPCALTALDHWAPEVKEQGMLSFIHLGKNVNATEMSWYEEPILDACCRNIASSDELWERVVEMSVLLLTCTQQRNPRSSWFERMLSEMLTYLERQPSNKEKRITWLLLIEPVFEAMGLVLLAHFRRIFSLFFEWMHADDDKTLLLVMERLHTVLKLTWVRKSPYIDRLVDELVTLYKEAAMRKNREVLRNHILEMLNFLQKCKGLQFETAWDKHKQDPDLTMLISSFNYQPTETFSINP